MSRISAEINLHGIEITVHGNYEPAKPSDWDYPGSRPEIYIETATVGGLDELPWMEADDWMEQLETALLEYLGEPIIDY